MGLTLIAGCWTSSFTASVIPYIAAPWRGVSTLIDCEFTSIFGKESKSLTKSKSFERVALWSGVYYKNNQIPR